MIMNGWTGKLLRVNLTTGNSRVEDIPPAWLLRFDRKIPQYLVIFELLGKRCRLAVKLGTDKRKTTLCLL